MFKPLTLGVGLAFALGACGISLAGGHGHGMPTPQEVVPSEQIAPSPQCETGCAPKKHCLGLGLGHKMKSWMHRPKCYTYTWVLKKKRTCLFGHHNAGCGNGCGGGGCEEAVYPSGQYASPQGEAWPTGQVYGAGQTYGAGQAAGGQMAPMTATPTTAGEEAPAAPAPPATTPAPPPPTAPAGEKPQASLLFPSPSGN
ncbi:MAG TPA: hypothetical protein VG406_08670 [Isosphaeraceae bacterium]|jgi:hypothetical protein|nr:hypothetical protein [Isosphaeraceae bacterium]